MRLANLGGRATLVVPVDDGVVGLDVATASGGRFGPLVQGLYDQWSDFRAFVTGVGSTGAWPLDMTRLLSPVPEPRQVFAVGLNYHSHAAESGAPLPEVPAVFTKFPASLSGPFADIPLSGPTVDWEVELVVVLGRRAERIEPGEAWSHVAGLSVGQDVSDRTLQFAAAGQFSLGKSYRGYGPIGPWLVTPDEFADLEGIGLRCRVNGMTVQDGSTADMVFGVADLLARISAICPLLPGDVVFTGTPAGTGICAQPPTFLQAGDVLESAIDGIGTIRNAVVPGPTP